MWESSGKVLSRSPQLESSVGVLKSESSSRSPQLGVLKSESSSGSPQVGVLKSEPSSPQSKSKLFTEAFRLVWLNFALQNQFLHRKCYAKIKKRKKHFWTPKRFFHRKLMKQTLFYSKSLPNKSIVF